MKPYILAKLDDTKNEAENDPAVVIIEDSDDVINVDISGEGSQETEAWSGTVTAAVKGPSLSEGPSLELNMESA